MDTVLHALGYVASELLPSRLQLMIEHLSTCASGIDRERNTGTGDVERFATPEAAGSIDANYWW
jgi:hypothetical protein